MIHHSFPEYYVEAHLTHSGDGLFVPARMLPLNEVSLGAISLSDSGQAPTEVGTLVY